MLNEETLHFIQTHRQDDTRLLALKPAPPGVDLRAALQQIEGRQAAGRKLPSWAEREGLLFPPRLAMEQCSSEQTARYKQDVVRRWLASCGSSDPVLTDLTGGFGIDFSFLAPLFHRAVYMERQPELCRIAAHNFRVLGLSQAEVRETDSAQAPECWPESDCCFVDPARRDASGRKTVAIGDCEPDLAALQEAIRRRSRFCLVKLSPMLDIGEALRALPHTAEVHAVSVQGECKELLLILDRHASGGTEITAVNLAAQGNEIFTFTRHEEETATPAYANEVETYLYEPNASVLKAGAFKSLATRFALAKLAPSTHLYTSKTPVAGFPGRCFKVTAVHEFNKQGLKALSTTCPKANIATRNFPLSPEELRKKLRIADGGDDYIFATTLMDKRKVMVVGRKAPQNP